MEPASENGGIQLRFYQHEMLEASMKSNVVVAMDTGSGKTHVAIARIRRELEGPNSSKLVWFLTPSVALAVQQHAVLSEHLPAYRIISLTGLDGVDKWTDQRLWDATLHNVNVVVGTPAVLLDALTHAFVEISRLSLLVFDEAHHCTKAHAMNLLLKRFYHPALERQQPVPFILGLTASPVVNSKQGSLEVLEANMNAISVTPKQHRDELERHVRAPEVVTVHYTREQATAPSNICSALATETQTYNLNTDPYVLELRERDDSRSTKELDTVLSKRKTYCTEQLRALDLRAFTLEEELGPSIATWYVSRCINRFREGLSGDTVLPDLSEHERLHLAAIFNRIDTHRSLTDHETQVITDKAQKLVHVLQENASPSLRAIVFVEQRVHVSALAELLGRIPEIQKAYRIASFVGTSASSKRKAMVADLVDLRDQQNDLDDFRSGAKNLMICTNVLEEGIDISACNLVVCFQLPVNLISFVQRRGRARKSGSKYVLFSNDEKKKPWAILEAEMKKMYMDETRQLPDRLEDELDLNDRLYRVDTTGALLTIENAKAHLFHFCSVGTMHASNYIDLRPEFDTVKDPISELWTATVDLPSFTHTSVRHASSSKGWGSEDLAVKDAAFEAYVALHKKGLINDNLLPLIKDYAPDTGQHLDQPSIVSVADRTPSWTALWKKHSDSEYAWHPSGINISFAGETLVDMIMWTPSVPPALGDSKLYWNRNITYTVKLRPTALSHIGHNSEQVDVLRASTKLLLQSVHASRMLADVSDFPVLFTPMGVAVADLNGWVHGAHGTQAVTEFFADNGNLDNAGLVRVASQAGKAFFAEEYQEEGIAVRDFPKRKDFLHPVAVDSSSGAAYQGKQMFPLSECTIDLLPAKYAVFAAFVPSIMHRVDTTLLAAGLNSTLLRDVGISDTLLVLEAISAPAAGEVEDYNRLEYLGDTCLKHCTELQIMAQHPTWPESYLTVERDRMVRNTNLTKAALDLGLDRYILTKAFTGSKWRPLYKSEILSSEPQQRQMSTKTLADVVEALIGAAFVDGGLAKALKCIETLLPTETWLPPQRCFDCLIEELRPTEMSNLELLERVVGHKFANPTLLCEAITHASLPHNKTGLSLERLEFLGDSVLDMLVTPKLFAHARCLRHDQMHGIHEALVNSLFLGHLCMSYQVDEEISSVVTIDGSIEIKTSARKVHLYDILRCGPQLVPVRQKSLEAFKELRQEIDEALASSKEYPWPALVAVRPQKFFCDLVESILGALFIDTRGDMSVCEAFAARLGMFQHMERILNDHVDTLSPKERMGIVADQDAVRYVNSRDQDGEKRFTCTVMVGERPVTTVANCGSTEEAEVKAAYKACKILEARGGRKRKVDAAGLGCDDADRDTGEATVGAMKEENNERSK